jgi:hypothetical protein
MNFPIQKMEDFSLEISNPQTHTDSTFTAAAGANAQNCDGNHSQIVRPCRKMIMDVRPF